MWRTPRVRCCIWQAGSGNPNNFKVVDGKLYLNLNDDMRKKWNTDTKALMGKAEAQWQQTIAK